MKFELMRLYLLTVGNFGPQGQPAAYGGQQQQPPQGPGGQGGYGTYGNQNPGQSSGGYGQTPQNFGGNYGGPPQQQQQQQQGNTYGKWTV